MASNNAIVGILRAILTLDTAQFQSGMAAVSSQFKQIESDWKRIGAQATALGSSLSKTVTLPLAAMGGMAVKSAMDFETSFSNVRKTVEATEPEFAKLEEQFRALAQTIPVNVNEINRLGAAAGALGIPTQQIAEFSRVMALLGATTVLTSDAAAESIAKIQTVFAAAGTDTERFGSTLVELGNNGASTEEEILGLARRVAGAGQTIGLTQAQVLGFSAAIANVGIESEMGGSAISRMFREMSTEVSLGGEQLKNFARVAGMSAEQFKKAFEEDAASAFVSFLQGLKAINDTGGDLNVTLRALEIVEVRQADTLTRLALSGDNVTDMLKLADKGWRENTALARAAEVRFNTVSAQLSILWAKVREAAIVLGEALLPSIRATVDGLNAVMPRLIEAAKWFAELPKWVQLSAVAFFALAAAAGPLLLVFGQLAFALSSIAGIFTTTGLATRGLALILGTAATAWRGFWLAALGPVGMVAAAVGWIYALTKAIEAYNDTQEATPTKSIDPWGLAAASAARAKEKVVDLTKAIGDMKMAASHEPVREFGKELDALRAKVAALTPEQRAAIDAGLALGAAHDVIAKNVGTTTAVIDEYISATARAVPITHKAKEKTKEWSSEYAKFQSELQNEIGLAQMNAQVIDKMTISIDGNATAAHEAEVAYDELRKTQLAADEAAFKHTTSIDANDTAMERAARALDLLIPKLKEIGGLLEEDKTKWSRFGETMTKSLDKLPSTILKAVTGGGNVGKAIGTQLGGDIGSHLGDALQRSSADIGGVLGKLGGMAAGFLGPLGALGGQAIVAGITKLGSALKSLFSGGEHAKVNDLRDAYVESKGGILALAEAARLAGTNVDKLLAAKRVKDFEAAVTDLDGRMTDFDAHMKELADEQAADMARLEDATKKYGFSIEELGPALAKQDLDTQAKELIEDWRVLVTAGVSVVEVNEHMAKTTLEYLQAAINTGTEVPLAMKPILESMIDQGVLVDANGKKVESLESIGVTFSQSMTQGFERVVKKLDELIARLIATGIAIEDLPDTYTLQGQYIPPDIPNAPEPGLGGKQEPDLSVPTFANEGIVRRPTLALVGDAPEPEMILRESTVAAIAGRGTAQGAMEQTISVFLDRRVLARAVAQGMPRELAIHGVR